MPKVKTNSGAKKSQQKMDRERREAEAKEMAEQQAEAEIQENASKGGLFANVKGGEDILNKLRQNSEE